MAKVLKLRSREKIKKREQVQVGSRGRGTPHLFAE